MKWKLLLIAATLLVLGSCTVAEKRSKRWIWPKNLIDIDSKDDGSEIGSGNNAFDTDDEDLFVGREGSTPDDDDDSDVDEISGSGTDSAEVTTLPETTRSLTACEQLKQSTKVDGYSSYVPKCTDNGEFERLQCRGTPLKGKCWCVGPEGTEIPGTLMDRPMTPDCVSGSNLKPCSYKYLKTNYKILGSNRPRCTFNGDYEAIQCYEAECWCVDQNGVEMVNTRSRGRSPVCEEKTEVPAIIPEVTKPSTATPSKEPKTPVTKPEYEIDPTDNGEVIIDDAFTPIPEVDESEKPKPVDETIGPILTVEDDDGEKEEKDQNRDNSYSKQGPLATSTLNAFVNKPFILGAIIAGAVVGLLGAILLVMFIVYRMRKKDEGSYALEEQKFTNYSYMKAPDKEFYA